MFLFFYILAGICSLIWCQLVVNVKNNGGDVYTEKIEANTTQDTIILEFRMADGTLVSQFIDGRNEIHIFKIVILPEEERDQTQVQTICFISRFVKTEFIASDAMSKLRQKNPSAIRHPEEQRPDEINDVDALLNVDAASVISEHIPVLCADAQDMTYVKISDLKLVAQILNRDYGAFESIIRPLPTLVGTLSCADIGDLHAVQPCLCHYNVCVGWYPCGLKYCRGKDSAQRVVSYRCGIKTCSKCRRFDFQVMSKNQCSWDDAEFSLPEEIGEPAFENAVAKDHVQSGAESQGQNHLVLPVLGKNSELGAAVKVGDAEEGVEGDLNPPAADLPKPLNRVHAGSAVEQLDAKLLNSAIGAESNVIEMTNRKGNGEEIIVNNVNAKINNISDDDDEDGE